MSTVVLGPIYRQLADTMGVTIQTIENAIRDLRQKLRTKLKGKPGIRDRLDDDWKKARNTRGRNRAVARALGKLAGELEDLGELASTDLADAERELWALLDILRTLEALENLHDHYDDMAKRMGY